MASELIPLTTFNNIVVHVGERGLVSLNDLWKAAGSPANRDPRQWARLPQTIRFIAHVQRELNVGKSHICQSSRGCNGGTWAHWKLALDYAAYLSESLKDHIYEVFKERIEEDHDPELGFQRWQERAERKYQQDGRSKEWVAARLRAILSRHAETDALKAHGIIEAKDYARLTNETYRGLFGGAAKQLKERRGVPERANLRDHLDEVELVSVTLAETLARHKIERDGRQGFRACADACRSSARHVAEAVKKDLGGSA
jgi:hypothetical protein